VRGGAGETLRRTVGVAAGGVLGGVGAAVVLGATVTLVIVLGVGVGIAELTGADELTLGAAVAESARTALWLEPAVLRAIASPTMAAMAAVPLAKAAA